MKRLLALCIFICLLLSSCGRVEGNKDDYNNDLQANKSIETSKKDNKDKGEESNLKGEFQLINLNELPSDIKNIADSNKISRGYVLVKSQDANYLLIFAGRKSSGGYSLKVKDFKDMDDSLEVIIEEEGPNPKMKVTMAITYPYIAIKFNKDYKHISVKDAIGNEFKALIEEK